MTDLMKPCAHCNRRELSDPKMVSNYRLCHLNSVVENAFGILAQRWHIYQCRLLLAPDMANVVVRARCILQNFLTKPSDKIVLQVGSDYVNVQGR